MKQSRYIIMVRQPEREYRALKTVVANRIKKPFNIQKGEKMNKAIIKRADESLKAEGIRYNVQQWTSHDGKWYYVGVGKFCKTYKEARQEKKSFEKTE